MLTSSKSQKGYAMGMPKSNGEYAFSSHQQELVASSPSQRNWRGIGIALLVIIVVCSFIVTAVIFLTPGDTGPRVKGERFTLDDVLSGNFSPDAYNATWISDTEFLYRSKDGNLLLYDAESRNATVLVSSEPFNTFHVQIWFLSPDRQYLLLGHNIIKVFRHSFLATYTIYDIKSKESYELRPDADTKAMLQYANWGPRGNSLVFVFANNVFYRANAIIGESKQLSASPFDKPILNGIPDWVYEEEILSTNSALWFSKNGSYLCYASFNDTDVPVQHFEWFGNPDPNYKRELLYPQPETIRYPKPAMPNPTVRLLIVNITDLDFGSVIEEHIVVPPESITPEMEHYFTAVTWASDRELSVIWMNRRQNLSIITLCSEPSWNCIETHREDMKQIGWVDWYEPPLFASDGKRYFVRGAVNHKDDGLFRQVVTKNVDDSQGKVLTALQWEVTKINAYDEKEGLIYFTVAPEFKPSERHLYRIYANGSAANMTGYCLTCDLSKDCLFNAAHFSPGARFYILDCQGPGVPQTLLFESKTTEPVDTLNTNEAVRENLSKKARPTQEVFKAPLTNGYQANVRLLFPPGMNKEEITVYPLIISVYAGPASQLVDDKFDVDWGTFLTSNMSYIYGVIDGRGSGFQGEKRKFELYRRLGTVEVEDQIAVANYLRDLLPYVDKKRIAIWGWSYGGFVTAKIMASDNGVFKCGISVAPVTNFQYYDSVYTERYMGFPTALDNEEGYARANVVKLANKFKSKQYYLIHGTADDNVHFQQSMLLSSELSRANVLFRSQVYPDQSHALSGVQKHLYRSMTNFLEECFQFDNVIEIVKEVSNKDDQQEPEE